MPFDSLWRKNRKANTHLAKSARRNNLLLRPVIEALEPRLLLSTLTPGSTYALVNNNSGLAADVPSSEAISGTLVVQYNWSSRSEQEWKITSLGSGHYEITNADSGLALGVTGAATTSDATVDEETYTGATSQQWSLTAVSGAFLITNVNSGLNLDVTSTSAYGGYGAQLIQNNASGGTSQDWTLQAMPSGWTDQDIGSPGSAGSADYTNYTINFSGATWNVSGGGADIYGTSDQFNFASQSFTGNGEIVAKVVSQTNTNASAKAGVMFRNTNAANSAFADVVVTPSAGVEFQWRNTAGGASYSAGVSGIKASVWVELVRSGNQFSGYYSTNGYSWIQIGSTQTITMNSTLLAGLAVTAHNNSSLSTAGFEDVSVEAPPVYLNSSGQLAYNALPDGDQIMDFSTAGYEEGGVPIPTVTTEATVTPSGDTTGATDMTNIQDAINTVSALPLVNGFRGAVLLEPGEFYVSGTLNITASGVVLEGSGDSGSGSGGTTIQMTTAVQILVSASGSTSLSTVGSKEDITEAYVPTGADTLTVASTSGWQVGDQIEIEVTETAAWIQYMGMDTLWRNGSQQTWIGAGSKLTTERTITAINGNQITLDAPVSDSINSNLQPGAYVEQYTSSVISQVGVQDMQILAEGPAQSVAGGGDEVVAYQGLVDGWVQNLNTKDTFNTIEINDNTSKITVQNVNITHSAIVSGDDAPADFAVNGACSQVLFTNLTISGDQDWYFTEGGGVTGPIVLMDSTFTGNGAVEPHQRWNTGLLVDNVQVNGGTIQFIDRGTAGSGQGQSAGASVIWNSSTTSGITVQNPPGTETWSIGDTGSINTYPEPGGDGTAEPMGIIYSPGVAIANIPSLYEAQLAQRLALNALPTGWTAQDIGGPEAIGNSSYNHNTGLWTISGSGADIYGTSDQFQYDSESVSGNAVISAEVDSLINTNSSAKAGVMFRNSNAANSAFADVVVTPTSGVEFQWRSTAGGSSSSAGVSGAAPVWVRLVRSGNSFSAYYSTNDSTWTQIGATETITMSTSILAGLAVSSHDNGVISTATFTNADILNVATAAAASPSPVTGKTTNLSVQGADSGTVTPGAITYTWSVTSKPNGATTPTFSVNGTTAANNTTATFYQAGNYTFLTTLSDAAGNSITGSVSVTVNLALTSITVSPSNPSVNANATKQFTATGYDQFGIALASQPTFTWSVTSGGGSVSTTGLYTAPASSGAAAVQAASGSVSGNTMVTIINSAPIVTTPASANPNPVTGTTTNLSVQGEDTDGNGNNTLTYTWSATALPAGAAAPTFSVNGTNTAQNSTATFSQAGNYTLTATITDIGGSQTTSSVNVTVNQTLSSVTVTPSNPTVGWTSTTQFSASANDQFGMAMLTQPTFTWSVTSGVGSINTSGLYTAPASSGSATVQATSGSFSGNTMVTITNTAPALTAAAAANPNPVTGTTTNLSVQGSDTDGQNNNTLIYTWSVMSQPNGAATPTFSVNGTDAAQNTTATFYQAGNYTFLATITDNGGVSITSSVNVTVDQTLSAIAVTPSNPTINVNSMQQFSASANDQFGIAMATQPTFTWSVTSGGGSISTSGLYTASADDGTATVQAAGDSMSGNTTVTIVNATPPTLLSAVSYKQQGSAGTFGINLALTGTASVEDRSNGPTDMVLTFNTAVTLGPDFSLSLSSGAGTAVAGGDAVTITMSTYATNGQTLVVGLNDVADATTGGNANYSFDVGVLLGDIFGSGTVTPSDLGVVESNLFQTVNSTNFTEDVGCAGTITPSDLGLVQSNLFNTLSPPSGGPLITSGAVVTSNSTTTTSSPAVSNGLIQTGGSTSSTTTTGGTNDGNDGKPAGGQKNKTNNHNNPTFTGQTNAGSGDPLLETPLNPGSQSTFGGSLYSKLLGWMKT